MTRREHKIRFTPTPVGTISLLGRPIGRAPVHPHACGDNGASGRFMGFDIGSPPRLWGQSHARSPRPAPGRFTPTPVGTISANSFEVPYDHPVHPHACGDIAQRRRKPMPSGSPPRLWGQCVRCVRSRSGGRFTPTPVGTMDFFVWLRACLRRFTPTPVGT